MSSQRLILAFAVLATLAVVAQGENAVLGQHQPGDVLVKETAVLKAAVSQQVVIKVDTYAPEAGKKITAIEVVDRNGDKSGTLTEIVGGGPGQGYAALRFTSRLGYGLNYVVKYYAK